MGKQRYTRKELRSPDEFISFSQRVWLWTTANMTRVAAMIGAAIVVVGASSAWSYYVDHKAQKATQKISRAMDIFHAALTSAGEPVEPERDSISPVPRFKSFGEKLTASKKELDGLIDNHGVGDIELWAVLLRAGVEFRKGDYDHAIKDYDRFLTDSDNQQLSAIAIEGVMYCYEAKNEWAKAVETVQRLPKTDDFKYIALFHEARILAKQNKIIDAKKNFKMVADNAGSRMWVQWAQEHLAMLTH